MISIDFSNCDQCGTCVSVCPADCITLAEDIHIDGVKCKSCGKCAAVCPFGALNTANEKSEEKLS